jgi:uncharacterized membrane protein
MWIRLRHHWHGLTGSYWFVPALMTTAAALLAFGLLAVDRRLIVRDWQPQWLYIGGTDGARLVLSTVAGSIITVAGVVFSITIVSLTQASSQFGPRLLRNFMRDTGNQVVLGTFVATFLYCLLVLRAIHGELDNGPEFVPQASVTAGVLLAIASIAVLIYFIHHVSVSLQAPSVIAAALQELLHTIDRVHEDPPAAHHRVQELPPGFEADARDVRARDGGYLQAIDLDGLLGVASKHDLVLRLEYRPGQYVIQDSALLRAWPPDRCGDDLARRLADCFITGWRATPEQDMEYGIRQLVEVAVRALSPGVNDPFTAVNCIDALGSAVCRIAGRSIPGPFKHDEDGQLRLVRPVTDFDGVVDAAFNQIRQHSAGDVAVTIRLLEVITACAPHMRTPAQRQALLAHAQMIARQDTDKIPAARDRQDIQERFEAARCALERP